MSDQHAHHDNAPTHGPMQEDDVAALAPLRIGDQIPWKLDETGEPQWLTVIAIESPGVYLVRDPSGNIERLRDSE